LTELYQNVQSLATTVLTILVMIFALFFAFVQISYSVNEIPKGIICKYTLKKLQTYIFITFFMAGIFLSGLFSFVKIAIISPYVLFVLISLAVILLIYYFIWFTRRLNPKGILNEIEKEVGKSLVQVNQFEEQIESHFHSFHKFIRENREQFKSDSFSLPSSFFSRSPSYTLKAERECIIGRIDVERIKKDLSDILKDEHVKVYFRVQPTFQIPEYIEDYDLLTLVFQEKDCGERDLIKAKLSFVENYSTQRKNIRLLYEKKKEEAKATEQLHSLLDREIKHIFKKRMRGLLNSSFEQIPLSELIGKSREALKDLNEMLLYSLEHEENFTDYTSSLGRIIYDQLFQNSKSFLHLRANIFRRLLADIGEAGRIAFSKGQDDYFDKILSLFYRVNFHKALPAKSALVYQEIFKTFDTLHDYFTLYRKENYNPQMETIIFSLSEWIRFSFKRLFENEDDCEQLEHFYKPVISSAIDTSVNIIRKTIDRYTFGIEAHQFKYLKAYTEDLTKLLDLYYTEAYEYMQDGYEFYDIAFKLKEEKSVDNKDKRKFELANAKAHIVTDMKKKLQRAIFALAAYITFKVELKEIPPDLVWKVAMRTANACKSRETDLWNQTVRKVFQEYPMLEEYRKWFDINSLHPVRLPTIRLTISFESFLAYWIIRSCPLFLLYTSNKIQNLRRL